MAYRQTVFSEAFGGEEASRPERLAALKLQLEALYGELRTDAAVAKRLGVSTASLKRGIQRMKDVGCAPEVTRRRGHPGGPRRRADRTKE